MQAEAAASGPTTREFAEAVAARAQELAQEEAGRGSAVEMQGLEKALGALPGVDVKVGEGLGLRRGAERVRDLRVVIWRGQQWEYTGGPSGQGLCCPCLCSSRN